MQRLCRIPARATRAVAPSRVLLPRTYATSSPKSAEAASAESGGSRSKDAAEKHQQQSQQQTSSPTEGVIPDGLAEGDARGRTGGGKPLESSHHPPARPKIYNASVHGGTSNMTDEQKAEVEKHNKEFESKHGKAEPAGDDKVNKSFWSGKGDRVTNS